ncbi:MAG: heme exporter protein CcmB [Flavobacteriales bacterium]|nr:heme exporter protein CcmB [Flavobacteriales bacterium]MBP6698708.1 heme exporter protein CcmB [Flavobacteriales bacterium]
MEGSLPRATMRPKEIIGLVRLEVALDLRQKASWAGMLLYTVSAVYLCYLGVRGGLPLPTWNALFWTVLLFAAFNALARSFQREDTGRQIYLHTLVDPRSVVLARTLYNMAVMLVLSLLTLAVYVLMFGGAVLDEAEVGVFVLSVVLGGTGFATVLTLISAIAARAGNGMGLTAILGFPLVLPLLLSVMRASKLALDGMPWSITSTYLLWLVLIDVLALALAYLLFPYLWRD